MLVNNSSSKYTWLWLGFVFACQTCGIKKEPDVTDIQAISVTSSIPVLSNTERLIDLSDTITIFSKPGIMIYRTTLTKTYSTITVDKEGDMISDSLSGSEKEYRYLIIRNGEKEGVQYSENRNRIGSFSVDSFLKLNTVTNFEAFFEKKRVGDRLIQVEHLANGDMIEKYEPVTKKDNTYEDTTILTFSKKLREIGFSFDKKIEKEKKRKLVRVLIIFNPKSKPDEPYLSFRRELKFEILLKEISKEEAELIEYFLKQILKT